MSDTHDERFHQHEEMLRSLTAMLIAQQEMNQEQREMNQRLTAAITELKEFNTRQLAINERLEITQARMETLFARLFRPDTNGRDA